MQSIRWLGGSVFLIALALAGCANQPNAQSCANGIVCPEGTTCAAVQQVCIVGNCGNGLTDPGETCDDGNILDGDGCSHLCKIEKCGNGDMDPGEKCDDGNTTSGDGCSADCKSVETCGNGIPDVTEKCDDGNTTSGDGCAADCQSTEVCGNGIKDIKEKCDDGGRAGGCSDDCQGGTGCGDGAIDKDEHNVPLEECDDGNKNDQDDCTDLCHLNVCGDHIVQTSGVRIESCDPGTGGVALQTATCNIDCTTAACGDGKVNPLNKAAPATAAGEQCDDKNAVEGDGCDSNCTLSACGNGVKSPTEACDDGNADNGDGCDDNCTVSACGNGVKSPTEACDDGNRSNGDGCSSNCVVEFCGDGIPNNHEDCDAGGVNSATCNADCTDAACGDGKINPLFKADGVHVEQCDDHNTVFNDGCGPTCQFEFCGDGIPNNHEPCDKAGNDQLCNADCTVPACGDGKINPAFKPPGESLVEQCDDHGTVDGDGCSATCRFEHCGNGVIDPGEDCDTAPVGGLTCAADCHLRKCGNGVLDPGEECDDNNKLNTDTCVSSGDAPTSCKLAKCGDGTINKSGVDGTTEQCDNGVNNGTAGNPCSATCHTIACGNGFLEGAEECDDGNASNTDDCVHVGTNPVLCKLATCGDGFTNSRFEECDHGPTNGNVGDTCSDDCRAILCGNGEIDPGEACDDGNALVCGACNATCSAAVPAEPATGLIVAAPSNALVLFTDLAVAHDAFIINDGLGTTITFVFVAGAPTTVPGHPEIKEIRADPNTTGGGMAALIAPAIEATGLQITAAQVSTSPLVVLTHKFSTTTGIQSITDQVVTTEFASTGMSGGHSGDCGLGTGCTVNSDCGSNLCPAATHVCTTCNNSSQCGAGRTCNVTLHICSP